MKCYYQDSAITIYHGDCLETMASLGSVDVTITDPPYSEHVHAKSRAGARGAGRELKGTEKGRSSNAPSNFSRAVDFGFAALSPELRRASAEKIAGMTNRWALVFSDVESSHLWRTDLESFALDYVRTGAWIKIGATPQFTGDRPAVGFEAITITHSPGKKRWNGGGSHAVWPVPIALDRGGTSPRNHPTEKPLALMTKLVSLFSDPGEVICDPFMGSGTTLRAAKDLGRRAIGIETVEKYCEIAARRCAQGVLSLERTTEGESNP